MSNSAFKNAAKSQRRSHKERHQPHHRRKLGLLEKHKDYVARARDYHRKETQLKVLREKARNRNPDEFYYKMTSTRLKGGKHYQPVSDHFTEEELKVLQTQDFGYTALRRMQEAKKIDRLQSGLHLLTDREESPPNKHTIFVESRQEVNDFDAARHFETAPELVKRAYNRPRLQTLQSGLLTKAKDERMIKRADTARAAQYEELNQRIEREKKLTRLLEEQNIQKHLKAKGKRSKIRGSDGRVTYIWKKQRKR
ncbi:probable U3 small nucleolar RNA-associated protein 11 [Corticium candelabrum]|uniref:probable U3 small nucleolar RNA-associated protein 11 n=1 Tax=Corticium candelabrum TaxID=121492 RepID=UPI002E26BD9A|nr:probable U3 small nucleolar RNA-associated protein 11 [Corticium candelabrum]